MKFMIMVFGDHDELHSKSPEWIERMTAFMVELDDELADRGELAYSEVLEYGSFATGVHWVDGAVVTRRGAVNTVDRPLSRYWVVSVSDEARAIEIAASVAAVLEDAVEVRQCMEEFHQP